MRVMALDMGERRVGVALSDPTGTVARPLRTLQRASREEDFEAINELVDEYDVDLVLVGRPLTLRGEVGPQAQRVQRYAEALAETLSVPLKMWDERYSTTSAEQIMRENRPKKKRRRRGKPGVDAVAAAVILQAFLDSQTIGSEADWSE